MGYFGMWKKLLPLFRRSKPQHQSRQRLRIHPAVEPLERRDLLATFTVISGSDNGDDSAPISGSLREAILLANQTPGVDLINFLAMPAPLVITPITQLPAITDAVVIDGTDTSQSGTAALVVQINGGAQDAGDGLTINGGGTTLKSLSIGNFPNNGVVIQNAGNNVIQNCFIGTDVSGTIATPNAGVGILVLSDNNLIGGTGLNTRNVISGNNGDGIQLFGSAAFNNVMQGNLIGTDMSGIAALANGVKGIRISSAPNNTIGGTAIGARNVISGNALDGVLIAGSGSDNNQVQGNYIGLDINGMTALGNGAVGVDVQGGIGNVIGGISPSARNVIASNGTGIDVANSITTGTTIQQNYIGIAMDGATARPNNDGVVIEEGASGTQVGGTTSASANVISGNSRYGVVIKGVSNGTGTTTNNVVLGNFIGTDGTGSSAISNVTAGVAIFDSSTSGNTIGGTTSAAANVISGNGGYGILFDGAGANTVQGNFIGTNATGSAAIVSSDTAGIALTNGTTGVVIGGSASGAGNLISGNLGDGILIQSTVLTIPILTTNNLVQGNRIGTNASGSAALPNYIGVFMLAGAQANMIGGLGTGEGNLISGNSHVGVVIQDSGTNGNLVQGNSIGVDINGTAAIGNSAAGVVIGSGAQSNLIGGTSTGARNIISGNQGPGVQIRDSGTSSNVVSANYIGTNVAGTANVPNSGSGVEILNAATSNQIGGPTAPEANVISGNGSTGVLISDAGTNNNIVLGNLIGTSTSGLVGIGNNTGVQIVLGAQSNTIGGTTTGARNVISGNSSDGIRISDTGSDANGIQGNFIGLNVTGTSALGNGNDGINLLGGTSTQIGGTLAGAQNVISGNLSAGIQIGGSATIGTMIQGNLIGLAADGQTARPNANGVVIANGAGTTQIGGTSAGAQNIISGNTSDGVQIDGSVPTTGHVIQGNLIGTNQAGTQAVGNGFAGIRITSSNISGNTIGGSTAQARNVISGNGSYGIYFFTAGANTVQGNYIGTNASGNAALGGQATAGIALLEGTTNMVIGGAGAGNVISGNQGHGILVNSNQSSGQITKNITIASNLIGTDAAGTASVGNAGSGVHIDGGSTMTTVGGLTSALRNIISGNTNAGVLIEDTGTVGNSVEGNYIGLDVNGTAPIGNAAAGVLLAGETQQNVIGGSSAGARNVISGNAGAGVRLIDEDTMLNTISGNYIGLNAAGTASVANTGSGVEILQAACENQVGGLTAAEANVISGNSQAGVLISGSMTNDNKVLGNLIGTTINGLAALGNGGAGVKILQSAQANSIGDVVAGARNVISGNGADGVLIQDAGTDGNSILGNYIGVDISGMQAVANQGHGISLQGGVNTLIGGTSVAARNVISGNIDAGIEIANSGTTGSTVQGNYIGLAQDGVTARHNESGVELVEGTTNNLIGGSQSGAANVISGNLKYGILIQGPTAVSATTSNNLISGNLIGTNAAGTGLLGNQGSGVSIRGAAVSNTVGGVTSAERNIISGNAQGGVLIADAGTNNNQVQGNYIGLDVNGAAAIANGVAGVTVALGAQSNTIGGNVAGARNIISGNSADGILIKDATSSGNVIQNNFIGLDSTGMQALANQNHGIEILGAANNTIGGTSSVLQNVISSNAKAGIEISGATATGNAIMGNLIGVAVDGVTSRPNVVGVEIQTGSSGNQVGGTAAGSANVISGNSNFGISIVGSGSGQTTGNQVQGNFIGTDKLGMQAIANGLAGISISQTLASGNLIGGTTAQARNLISGNGSFGIRFDGSGANTVQGNYIGTDVTGNAALLGQNNAGVALLNGTTGVVVGGIASGAMNLISANRGAGITISSSVSGPVTQNNQLAGNRIGTDSTGMSALGNQGAGIVISAGAKSNTIGGMTFAAGNLISGNLQGGVIISGSGTDNNLLQHNFVGVDRGGFSAALPNSVVGVLIAAGAQHNVIGGSAGSGLNVISGNTGPGVRITDPGTSLNTVASNLIGTGAGGQNPVPNTASGIEILLGASSNTIGGPGASDGNTLSGNRLDGLQISGQQTSNNTVIRNLIGVSSDGLNPMPNQGYGIRIQQGASNNAIGGSSAGPIGAGNIISTNALGGIFLTGAGSSNAIQGNLIGTGARAGALGNTGAGMDIVDTSNTSVGGATSDLGNTIVFNSGTGVVVRTSQGSAVGNGIRQNAIFSNQGLGIDLGGDGVTQNTPGGPHAGPNSLQNFPVLGLVFQGGNALQIDFSLNAAPSMSFMIEFFGNVNADPSGFGQGQQSLGTITVTTDASGNASGRASLPLTPAASASNFFTATATDTANNTSEFSKAIPLSPAPVQGNLVASPTTVVAVNGLQATNVLVATFVDTLNLSPGAYQATIDWGDQTPSTTGRIAAVGNGYEVRGDHTYVLEGNYAIRVTIAAPGRPAVVVISTARVVGFVTGLYQTVMERQPDPVGLSFWQQQLHQGASRIAVSQAFWESEEHRGLEVAQFYQTVFHRAPDAQGRAFWVHALLTGTDEATVVISFFVSPEFTASHPDSASFVRDLYLDILDRQPDVNGQSFWEQILNNGVRSRRDVVFSFLTSNESYELAVRDYYLTFLGRAPDPEGGRNLFNLLVSGKATPVTVAAMFLGSEEYLKRQLAMLGQG